MTPANLPSIAAMLGTQHVIVGTISPSFGL